MGNQNFSNQTTNQPTNQPKCNQYRTKNRNASAGKSIVKMFYAMRGICEHAYSRSIRAVHVQFSRYAIDRVWAYWKEHSPLPARPTCAIGAFAANYGYCHNAPNVVQWGVFRGTKPFRGFNPFPLTTWILYHTV